jgi:hypothetical protein
MGTCEFKFMTTLTAELGAFPIFKFAGWALHS